VYDNCVGPAIGLGALSASLTKGGLTVQDKTQAKLTTGRIFTSKIIVDTLVKALEVVDTDLKDKTVAVVGAAGSIGTMTSQLLVHNGVKEIILIDLSDKQERIKWLTTTLKHIDNTIAIRKATVMSMVADAHAVIAATNRKDAIIKSEHVSPGTIIVDDAQPSDVDIDIIQKRDDVLVLEGGVVQAPLINTNFNFGLHNKTELYSCLGEAILLRYLEHDSDFSLGQIEVLDKSKLKLITDAADDLKFEAGQLQNNHVLFTEDQVRQKIGRCYNHR